VEEDEEDRYVTVARLLRPRGNRGELIAEDLSGEDFGAQPALGPAANDDAARFFNSGPFFLRDSSKQRREVAVERAWLHQGRLVLKLKGVDSISDAEALRNVDLQIPRERLGPASDGEYYFEDLIGCDVRDAADGRLIGSVEDVLEPGGALLLQVDAEGREVLIPFVQDICVEIAPEKKAIRVRLPAGLENLNP
jgi:16S rRNA processing protein RimM